MGTCASGGDSRDQEVDLFLSKHHKRAIVTDKSCYEVSKQQIT